MMESTRSEKTVETQAVAFDSLTRSLSERLPRRRAVGLLVATLGTGLFGIAAHTEEVSARRRRGGGRRPRGPRGPRVPPTTPEPPAAPQPALCLAVNNVCGTNAGLLGRCRRAVAADADASLICTSNTAGNACASSLQCGAGTRCVVTVGVTTATCRIVIP